MKYSKSILGKNIFDLDYQDLVHFFLQEREESLNLEFKSYVNQGSVKDKEKVIFKSICALLNSEGGIIIWGAPTELRYENGNTKAIGNLTPFNIGLDKDKLINKISSAIVPLPTGVNVNFLKNDEDKFVVVIEVEKSVHKPHQFDNLYFIRLDGQTRIAPHYLIKALIQSTEFPIIRGHIRLKFIEDLHDRIKLTFRQLIYNTSPYNNEINPFYRLVVQNPGKLYINDEYYGGHHEFEFSILANGRPDLLDFCVIINKNNLQQNVDVILQFGGEKSPSKMSIYTYNFSNNLVLGAVTDENEFLVEKNENQLPTDFPSRSDDDKIEDIMQM
ncbi:helix-turn-helix domain-containing protein [Chryseobacterium zhengzhouense]|uniref:Helix-turn-helix domain-containing protein n=1 Tax=Chryseobacterium zhengzhouense TaxID=1636086 RepID=A0ABW2M695_9FLAO